MQFHVRFDESIDTYDKMKSVMEKQSGNSGAMAVITQKEYDGMKECFANILQYYKDYFEIEAYAGDETSYECDIVIDFEAGFDVEKLQELKVEQLLQTSGNEAHSDEKELDTLLAKLIVMNKNSRTSEGLNGMTRDGRNYEDLMGEYADGRIRLFWPRICLLAAICARRNRLPEAEERLFLFEEALGHELFHFFQACCVGEGFREPYNVYISHMAECMAEFFSKKYMGHISKKRDQEAQLVGIPRDPWNFYPGGESSDGGYSGAAILLDSMGHREDMHNEFYVKLFNSVCSTDKAREACEGLKRERNYQFGLF